MTKDKSCQIKEMLKLVYNLVIKELLTLRIAIWILYILMLFPGLKQFLENIRFFTYSKCIFTAQGLKKIN